MDKVIAFGHKQMNVLAYEDICPTLRANGEGCAVLVTRKRMEPDFDMAEFNKRRQNYGKSAAVHEGNLAALGGLMISSGLFPVPVPMLAFGTLLGYVRSGHCIEGDHDADVILPHDTDMGKVLWHREKFGFKICRVATDLFSLERNNQYVDIYLARPRTTTDTWIARYYAIPNEHYDNPTRIEWLGREWKVPADPEGYLARVYGEDWRTPKEGCHAQPVSILPVSILPGP